MDTGDRFGGSDRLERIASGRARTWNSCWRRLAGVASSRVSRGGNRFTGAEIYPRCRRRCRETRRYPPRLELRPAVSRASCYYRTRALTTLARAARFATAPRGSFRPLGREINNQTRTCRAGSSLLAARVDRVGGVLFQTRPSVGCIPDRPRGDWRRPRVGERDRRTLGVEGGGGSIRGRAVFGISSVWALLRVPGEGRN